MTTDDVVVDVSQDWVLACDVQQRFMQGLVLADSYATVFYGVFDGSTRMLRYANAGHTPPVVLRRTGSIDRLEIGRAPVGMFPESTPKTTIFSSAFSGTPRSSSTALRPIAS